MNTTRFINFGKYDLATNKVFYRNMVIVALSIGACISALGFLGRYLTWKSKAYVAGGEILDVLGYASYTNSTVTNVFLTTAIGLMITIFAGCTFHSLRKKQGRINELTLPASNSEKFVWHVLLCVGGGLLLCFASLLTADLVNYILHLAVYGNDGTFSLTSRVMDVYTMNIPINPQENIEELEIVKSTISTTKCMFFCTIFMQICAYIYGNSVKYKYNIILTYLALTVIGILVMITVGSITQSYLEQFTGTTRAEDLEIGRHLISWAHAGCVIVAVVGILLFWRSFARYKKAQVTSRLNK